MGGKYRFDQIPPEERRRIAEACGLTEEEIRASWQPELEQYKKMRKKYLLYPDYPTQSNSKKK